MKPTEIVAAALTAPDMAGSGERETRIEIPEAMLTARAMDARLKRGIPIQTRMIARDMARKDAPEIPTGIQEATRTEPDTAANPKQETRIEIPEAMQIALVTDDRPELVIPTGIREAMQIVRVMGDSPAPAIPIGIRAATRTEPDTAANPKQETRIEIREATQIVRVMGDSPGPAILIGIQEVMRTAQDTAAAAERAARTAMAAPIWIEAATVAVADNP